MPYLAISPVSPHLLPPLSTIPSFRRKPANASLPWTVRLSAAQRCSPPTAAQPSFLNGVSDEGGEPGRSRRCWPATASTKGNSGRPRRRRCRDKGRHRDTMQRSPAPLLRSLHSWSICSSSSGKIAASKIDPVVYSFHGSSFPWRQQHWTQYPCDIVSKPDAKCKSLGFSQHIRCLGSRAAVLMNVHASGGEIKKGRWTCPKCQFINSAQHQRCLGCLEPDSISISRSPTFGFSLGADSQNTRRVGLPQSIVKYCVLRSPHIDKKSREQFEMRIKKLYMVVKTQTDDLQKKFFWLKRQRILGAQYEIIFSYKTRLPLKPAEEESP